MECVKSGIKPSLGLCFFVVDLGGHVTEYLTLSCWKWTSKVMWHSIWSLLVCSGLRRPMKAWMPPSPTWWIYPKTASPLATKTVSRERTIAKKIPPPQPSTNCQNKRLYEGTDGHLRYWSACLPWCSEFGHWSCPLFMRQMNTFLSKDLRLFLSHDTYGKKILFVQERGSLLQMEVSGYKIIV